MTRLTDEQIDDQQHLLESEALNPSEHAILYTQWEIVRALTRIADALEMSRAG